MKQFLAISDILALYQDEISEKYKASNQASIEVLQAYTHGDVDMSEKNVKTEKKFVPITEQLQNEGHSITYNVDENIINLFNIANAITYKAQMFLQRKPNTYSRVIEQRLNNRYTDVFLSNYDLIRVDGLHYSHFTALRDIPKNYRKALWRECVITICNTHKLYHYDFDKLPKSLQSDVWARFNKFYNGKTKEQIAKNSDKYIKERYTDNHDYVMTAFTALLENVKACNGNTDTVIGYKPMQYDTSKYIVEYGKNNTVERLLSVNKNGELMPIISSTSYRALIQINADLIISITCVTPFSLAFSAVSSELQKHRRAFNVNVSPETISSEGYIDNTLDDKIAKNEILSQVFSLCTDTQEKYLRLYIRINPNTGKRFTYADIAKIYGKNKSSVSRAIQKVFDKARQDIKVN